MLGRPRRHGDAALSYRIPLWGSLLVAVALVYFDHNPMLLETSAPESAGEPVRREHASDVVVVVDYRAIAESPDNFPDHDWSSAWIDAFEQHVGPVTVVTPEHLASDHLDDAHAVVLTASVADKVPDAMVSKLREETLEGLLLVLERPRGRLRDRFAANGDAGLQRGREVTFAAGLDEPYDDQLAEMPIEGRYLGSTEPRENAETVLAIDGAPVVYRIDVGDGDVVTVDFEVGRQLVALQQGQPDAQFRVAAQQGTESHAQPPRTAALVADETMRGASVPYADLFERFVVYGILYRHAPIAGIWPFPDDAAGVVVPIHQDRRLGDGGGWMLEYEAERDATSTLLTSVDAGLTPAGAAVVGRRGGEIGLLWRKEETPARRLEHWGLAGLEPIARAESLDHQVDELASKVTDGDVATVKTAGRWWDRRWARPFRRMAARDLPLDLSYEPDASGFAFGTGFPTRMLDRNGLPVGVRELPVVVPSRASTAELTPLLETSRDGHHQVLTHAVRPASFGEYPDIERFDQWVDSFRQIRRTGHVVRNAGQFLQFWRARLRSSVESRLVRGVSIPDADEPAKGVSRDGDAVLLRISADLERDDLAITAPASIDDKPFVLAKRRADRAGGELVAGTVDTQVATVTGYRFRRIPLEAGSTRTDLYYGQPKDEENGDGGSQ